MAEPKRDDDDQVFEVGEKTVMKMQSQAFLDEEFGTMAIPEATELPVDRAEDEVAKLRRRVDALQRRLDSIDTIVARLVANRT